MRSRHETALATRAKYEKEIAQTADLHEPDQQTGKRRRGRSAGRSVPEFSHRPSKTRPCKAGYQSSPAPGNRNAPTSFFSNAPIGLTIQSTEAQLVDFLYKLGDGNSLIRVRALSLRPDAPRQALSGNLTLIASYQKKPSARPAPAPRPGPGGNGEDQQAAGARCAGLQTFTPTKKK